MRLADFILQHMEEILVRWEEFAGGLPNARSISLAELRDHAEQILGAVCNDLGLPQTTEARDLKGKGRAPAFAACETAAQPHALLRARAGFDMNEMAAEYQGLRASVLGLWLDAGDLRPTDLAGMLRFNEAIDQAICAAGRQPTGLRHSGPPRSVVAGLYRPDRYQYDIRLSRVSDIDAHVW